MAPSNGLKTLNSGWQVWGGANSSRHPSSSSATSIQESAMSHSLSDGWGSRSASGTWDEIADAQQKELASLVRQRQVSAQSGGLPASGTGATKPASQQYNAVLGHNASPVGNYDSLQSSSLVDTDLSVALRGMAVEDEYGLSQQNAAYRQGSQPSGMAQPSNQGLHVRGPQQAPRGPYGGYPQTEYAAYYSGPSYSYDAYRTTQDPSMYASSPALTAATAAPSVYHGLGHQALHPHDLHAQQFYEYVGSPRTLGSQYYYPTQPLVYHAPPSHSPMLTPHQLAGGDKRRDQALSPQNVLYANLRSSPSPHSSPYGAAVDYSPQLAHGVPRNAVFPHGGAGPGFVHGGRHGRRGDGAVRSAQLDEFRANKSRRWELRDIFGYIVEFSGDQHGSRFIQQRLESATSEEMEIVFDEIVPQYAIQLMQDVFGNYVVQKMFEYGTQAQKTRLVSTMEGQILGLSLQMYGCRVVQKAIEYVGPEQQAIFIQELSPSVLRCVKDANGNHVIQKIIEHVAPDRLGFVNAFRGSVYELSTHPYGCRVLQRCFEYLPEDQTRPLLDELHKYVSNLMIDQFGNYVVQFVLENGKPQDRAMIIAKLTGQMNNMAKHKFASNVCEKALLTADADSRRMLIDEIMTPKQDGLSPIMGLMKDSFGNYVLQRALTIAEGEQRELLISKVRPHLANMRRYSSAYSKHLAAIERLLEKCSGPTASEPAAAESVKESS
ncbi:ARM repeat-containing protein [Lentinus brumalis]|uniref:Pumilio homology domain family member 3 n=1 Tax=Lentinus brumalis TaxID=2498619 RepID=A0A371DVT6_9APHY|nr:ARM repeat-containing protein [Polyporus brumalis]